MDSGGAEVVTGTTLYDFELHFTLILGYLFAWRRAFNILHLPFNDIFQAPRH